MMSEDEAAGGDGLSYKEIAEAFKEQGNDAMKAGSVDEAIKLYSQAIGVDPDNHIYYSNRSAAYLTVSSISKALKDAEKCVALAPRWSKGYSRLGAAQHALRRLDAAIATFKQGIELDPTNAALWKAMRAAEEAQLLERQARHMADAAERAALERQGRHSHSMRNSEQELADFFTSVSSGTVTESNPAPAVEPVSQLTDDPPRTAGHSDPIPQEPSEDDALASFFSEVSSAPSLAKSEAVGGESRISQLTKKYVDQDLGNALDQHARLTSGNYKWRNLNPYEVLQLDIDANVEDIKYRYKKLSGKVHPDKLRDIPLAREAFEQVKEAYQKLMDDQQRDTIIMNIEFVVEEANKERRRLLGKGVKESTLPTLSEDIRKRLLKHFADIELKKQKSQQNLHAHNSRERMMEDTEKEKLAAFEEFEKEWSEGDRREKRVGSWREFQVEPESKRVKASSYKEEARDSGKFGQVKVETWKKSWK